MGITSELTPDKIKKRLSQAEEMEQIWNDSRDPIKMYLKGCIVTANTLARSQDTGGAQTIRKRRRTWPGRNNPGGLDGEEIVGMKDTWGREVTVDTGFWRNATGNGWTGKEPRGLIVGSKATG